MPFQGLRTFYGLSVISLLVCANSQGPLGLIPDGDGVQSQAPASMLAGLSCIVTGELAITCQPLALPQSPLNSPLANATIVPCCTMCTPIVSTLPLGHVTVPVTITCLLLLPGTNVAIGLTEKLETPAKAGLAGISIRARLKAIATPNLVTFLFIIITSLSIDPPAL
jgi:hypothetical protein